MTHADWAAIWQEMVTQGEVTEGTRLHAQGCAECLEKVERARRLDAQLRSARVAPAPEAWVERAVRKVTHAGALVRENTEVDEILLDLVSDSLQPMAGVRGSSAAMRTRLCRGGGFLVSIREEVGSQGIQIRGQVVPSPNSELPADGVAQLVTDADTELSSLSKHGEFLFGPVKSEVRELVLLLGNSRIRVPHHES